MYTPASEVSSAAPPQRESARSWWPGSLPRPTWVVVAFFLADVGLIGVYWLDASEHRFGSEVDLNREANLPTYFAATQLAVVGLVVGLLVARRVDAQHRRSWLLLLLPLLMFGLAADELVRVHEDVGLMLDHLPGANRRDLPFDRTGIWMFVVGLPFTIGLFWWGYLIRDFFPRTHLFLAGLGFGLMLGGAIGVETFANFVEPGSRAETFQVLGEEGLELIGVTTILWAAAALVRFDGTGTGTERIGPRKSRKGAC